MSMSHVLHSSWSHCLRVTLAAFACVAILPVAACKGQNPDQNRMTTSPDAIADAPPLRNLNPTPVRAYEIRVRIEDAPGPFVAVEGAAQYDVQNAAECGKPAPVSGAIPRITSNEPISLTKVSDTEYAGTLYVDRILDEDYYGRGVCQWTFVEVRVRLRGADDEMATRFVATLPASDVAAQTSKSTHFWDGHYPRATLTDYANFGNEALDHVPADERDQFFVVEITAKEVQP